MSETNDWHAGLFDRSPALLARAAADGTIAAVNPAWAAALGRTAGDLAGAALVDLAHPDDRAAVRHALDAGLHAGEARFAHAGGGWRVLRWQAARDPGGALDLAAADVTEQREELAALAAAVSHDLRAPLRAIDGFSRVLLADGAGLPEETARYLALVRDAGTDMARLLDGLMRVLEVARAPFIPEHADPAAVAGEVIELVLRERQGDRDVTWVVEPLPPCEADVPLLRRLFEELLGNALAFTAPVEHARIEVRHDPATNAYIVADDGVGFDDRQLARAFEIFGRLHPAEQFPGAGAGLAVAQRIVARHGGTLTGRSARGAGATFSFTLP